jgi:hypothetical protein
VSYSDRCIIPLYAFSQAYGVLTWIDAVEEDAKKLMGVRNWKRAAQEREEWRGLIREAKARYRAVAP